MAKDIAASIRQRLLDLARTRQEDFDFVLRQYVIQRLLYRLSCSAYVDQFLLKGALLFWIWNVNFHRPTRDIDLLSFGDNDVEHLVNVFQQVIHRYENDGLVFEVDSLRGSEIKEHAEYSGVRLAGFANLAKARIPFQVDIGFGDTVVPLDEKAEFPSFLDLPTPKLRIYPVYGMIAEKFQAIVMLGMANSRMKDFYDINIIAHTMKLDGNALLQAVNATFDRRKTEIIAEPLYVFSTDFKQDQDKHKQWRAFLSKNALKKEMNFNEVIDELKYFLEPVYKAIAVHRSFRHQWLPEEFLWEKK